MKYLFKRKIYYRVCAELQKQNTVFLLGPRKCGKTICLHQLNDSLKNVKYNDLKTLGKEQAASLFDEIHHSIESNDDVIYLIDEITYAEFPEREINIIALLYSEYDNDKTHVVFTGSQSAALEAWANRAFCGNTALIYADFLQYDEWLQYAGRDKISAETYSEFLYSVRDFYNLNSLQAYLQGCLEETIVSNMKTDNIILNNDCSLLDTDILLDVCYATLFTLHNHTSAGKFFQPNRLQMDISFFFRDICKMIGNDEIAKRIERSFIGHYSSFRSRDLQVLKQAFWFLQRIGLITLTPVCSSIDNVPNVLNDLVSDESKIDYKRDLFVKYNACIKYPMFYIAILQDILANAMPDELPPVLLGSIMECHARGLLPVNNAFELQDTSGREIDYVNLTKSFSVEMTISNKRSTEQHFDMLPEYFMNIMLTKDIYTYSSHYCRMPYYEFIYRVSKDPSLQNLLQDDSITTKPKQVSF